jgi:hypothetical protein
MASNAAPSSREQELMTHIFGFKYDPLAYVMYAFPWGVPKTPLSKFDGPRQWQRDEFEKIRRHMAENQTLIANGQTPKVYYLAISSGRGIGKSAFLAMLSMWFMSCWVGGTNVVTANTETQLRSRTMAELGKWAGMAINAHWFEKTSMTLRPNKWFAELLSRQLSMDSRYYYTEAQTWSAENPDGFAGVHSQIGTMVQFDEASGIDEVIWPVTDGFFTDLAEFRMWVAISNPRRNTGSFFECFHTNRDRWCIRYIDSRTIEGVDISVYERIVEQYGEDHDVTRVEVKGEFPRTGSNQFIGRELAQDAALREVVKDEGAPLLMGVDVARFGDDESVIRFRRGRDARTLEPMRFKGMDTMEFSSRVAEAIERYRPDAVFVDGGGVGGGVVDRLKQLGFRVIEVQSGERAEEREQYMNKRAEMWGRMKDWLATGCVDEGRLVMDMTAPEYDITLKGQLRLETKDSMKKRGLNSPDDADALALTFAEPIARNDVGKRRYFGNRSATIEYDVFSL